MKPTQQVRLKRISQIWPSKTPADAGSRERHRKRERKRKTKRERDSERQRATARERARDTYSGPSNKSFCGSVSILNGADRVNASDSNMWRLLGKSKYSKGLRTSRPAGRKNYFALCALRADFRQELFPTYRTSHLGGG